MCTGRQRYLVGEEIMMLMGMPLHRYSTSGLSNNETDLKPCSLQVC